MTNDNEIYTQLDRITDHLATMTKQERIAWFRRSAYAQPLNFTREIDGTVYAVRAFFLFQRGRKRKYYRQSAAHHPEKR